jgi:hypothetical protein
VRARNKHGGLVAQVPRARCVYDTPCCTASCALVHALRDQTYLRDYDYEALLAAQPDIEAERRLMLALIACGLVRPSNIR